MNKQPNVSLFLSPSIEPGGALFLFSVSPFLPVLPKRLLNTPLMLELKLFLCLMLLLLGDEVEEVVGEIGFSERGTRGATLWTLELRGRE